MKSVSDPTSGGLSYEYNELGLRTRVKYDGTNRSVRYEYLRQSLPKDDPNSQAPLLTSIYDETTVNGTPASSRVDYTLTTHGDLVSAQYNQIFDFTNGDPTRSYLASACETGYTYQPGSTSGSTRMWLSQIKHLWNHLTPGHLNGMTYVSPAWDAPVTLLQNDYANYDAVGNRQTNHLFSNAPGSATDRTEAYGYDNLYRLTSANYGDGLSQVYTFDPMGNRTNLSETVSGSTASTSYEVDPANRLTYKYSGTRPSSPNVVSDPNGNVLSDGTRTNVWDSENRLRQSGVGTKTSTFTYGADGLRRTMTVSDSATPANNLSKTFLLDNGMPVAERQNTGATATTPSPTSALSVTYLQGARGPECMREEASGLARWYLTDGLGSVLGEVLPSGGVDGKRKLDVYGVDRGKTGTLGSSQGFVGNLGHQTDEGTGLVYMRARYYDPNTGRFVSQDPAKSGANWYRYCSDNPVNMIDRDGNKDGPSNFDNFLGRLAITCLGLTILYLFLAIAGVEVAPWTIIGSYIGAVFSALSGVYGPTLIKSIATWLKLVDATDKSDGGTNANGIAKEAVEAVAIEESQIYGELLTQEIEGSEPWMGPGM